MLKSLFEPRSVAVIGAAREEGKVGRVVFDNLIAGFEGPIYPVNPKAAEIHGYRCFSSLREIGGPVDLIVVAIPACFISDLMSEAGDCGVKAAIIISAGFKETGVDGARLEKEAIEIAKKNKIRILGPNCLGLMDTSSKVNASFAGALPRSGGIAFMSQSGALCTSILDWAKDEDIGFSKFISLGNKADVSEIDLLPFLADDKNTTVITAYMEGVNDGRAFMRAAIDAGQEKPIVVLKSGTTNAGAKAVSSHTGTLAGSENVYNVAFKQSGIVRALSVEDLFDFALGFSRQPLPKGRRLAVVTNAGGPGIMAADAIERQGLFLANFNDDTIKTLHQELPVAANVYNPVDVLGDALADRYEPALKSVLADKNVDGVIVLLTPQAMTEIAETASEMIKLSKKNPSKPIYACFMGGAQVRRGIEVLRTGSIPNYHFPERAVAMVKAGVEYVENKKRSLSQIPKYKVDTKKIESIISGNHNKQRFLVDVEALAIINAYGVKTARTLVTHTVKDALDVAADFHYPVVLKIASPDVLHKTDIGAIRVGIENDYELRAAYREILTNVDNYMPDADIWGVTVQEMIRGGHEVIVGMNRDSQFGPLIMFGLGGIYVEVLKDVSFRLAPLTVDDARLMVTEIRSYLLLQGSRGQSRADTEGIIDALLRVSQLVTDWPQIEEMDINPLIVLPAGQGVTAADARIGLMGQGRP